MRIRINITYKNQTSLTVSIFSKIHLGNNAPFRYKNLILLLINEPNFSFVKYDCFFRIPRNPRIAMIHIEIRNQIQINSVCISVRLIYCDVHFNWLCYILEFKTTLTNDVSEDADSMMKYLGQFKSSVSERESNSEAPNIAFEMFCILLFW